jgi:hypothetical protein
MLIWSIFSPWAVIWGSIPVAITLVGWFFSMTSHAVDVVFLAHAKHKYIHKDPVPDRSAHVSMRLTAERSLALRPRSLSCGPGGPPERVPSPPDAGPRIATADYPAASRPTARSVVGDHHRSSRRPLKKGCRTLPSADFARYSISARCFGSTHALVGGPLRVGLRFPGRTARGACADRQPRPCRSGTNARSRTCRISAFALAENLLTARLACRSA